MKKHLLILFLVLLSGISMAQISPLESLSVSELRRKLSNCPTDTGKIRLEIILGRVMLHENKGGKETIDSALTLGRNAENRSRRIGFNDGIVDAMLLNAMCTNAMGNSDLGLKMAMDALMFSQKVKNAQGTAEAYIVIGHHYVVSTLEGLAMRIKFNDKALVIFRQEHILYRLASLLKDQAELYFLANKKPEAVKMLFEALNVNITIGNKRVHGIYWLIARTSNELGDYPNALKYNFLAIKTAKAVNDSTLQLCSIYNMTATTYITMKEFKLAIPYSLQALKIAKRYHNFDYIGTVSSMLAIAYSRSNQLDKGLALLNEMKKNVSGYLDELSIMDDYLINLNYVKKFKEAAPYATKIKSLLARTSPENYDELRKSYSYLAQYYLATKNVRAAKYYNDLYSEIAHRINYINGIKNAEKYYFQIDSINGDFKSAMRHYLVSQRLKDSLDNVTKAYQISLLQIENEIEKKNSDIDTLKKQTEVKDTQLKRNHLIQKVIVSGIILLLIITALTYSRYRLKQRSNALLQKQKAEIDLQNIELQDLVDDKSQLINDKDELIYEKDLLLKEVNHRVKNNLQIVMSLLDSQSGYMQNKKAQEAILESQNRVRSIALIHDQLYKTDKVAEISIRPYIGGLIRSLDESLNHPEKNVSIDLDVDDIMLDVSQAIPVGLILNESVTNALKYAFPDERAGKIIVKVKKNGGHIELQVRDNGIGLPEDFDPVQLNSLGIILIRGLTAQLKGVLSTVSDDGLALTVKFPAETATITNSHATYRQS